MTETLVTSGADNKSSEKRSRYGSYLFDRTRYSAPDGMNNVELGNHSSRQFLAAEETHSFAPTFVNAVRFGFNHEAGNNNQSTGAINAVATDGSLGSFAGRNAAQVQIGGASLLPGRVGGLPTHLHRSNSFHVY